MQVEPATPTLNPLGNEGLTLHPVTKPPVRANESGAMARVAVYVWGD